MGCCAGLWVQQDTQAEAADQASLEFLISEEVPVLSVNYILDNKGDTQGFRCHTLLHMQEEKINVVPYSTIRRAGERLGCGYITQVNQVSLGCC